eukprot:TRINITY_DN352_c0_g1_i2.p2 TRINITY_DN352_c0_g1~~TRINITY_DN352_c0_g1_i2.p2  ORF type:complete len:107 (-),score=10.31 TRINITY_DN352_c0_g1_i2:400-720(-)
MGGLGPPPPRFGRRLAGPGVDTHSNHNTTTADLPLPQDLYLTEEDNVVQQLDTVKHALAASRGEAYFPHCNEFSLFPALAIVLGECCLSTWARVSGGKGPRAGGAS